MCGFTLACNFAYLPLGFGAVRVLVSTTIQSLWLELHKDQLSRRHRTPQDPSSGVLLVWCERTTGNGNAPIAARARRPRRVRRLFSARVHKAARASRRRVGPALQKAQ